MAAGLHHERLCDILVRSLAHCREHKGLKIYGWVTMDNHFHAILAGPALAQTLADLKKFTAREVIAQLPHEGWDWLLNQLSYYRAAHKQRSRHQVWQEVVHPQAIVSDEMMLQKLEYLQTNPVKRGLVASPEHWRYSSAHEGCRGLWRCCVAMIGDRKGDRRRNGVAGTSAFPNRVWARGEDGGRRESQPRPIGSWRRSSKCSRPCAKGRPCQASKQG